MVSTYWDEIEADLQDLGIDVDEAQHAKSWHWLSRRIFALRTRPAGVTSFGTPVPPNRLQAALMAAEDDTQQDAPQGVETTGR